MKKFIYENKYAQANEVIFYTFHPDLVDASEQDLRDHIKILCQHTPPAHSTFKNEDGTNSRTVNPEAPNFKAWQEAANHAQHLLREKVANKGHWRMFYVSVVSLVLVFFSLLYNITVLSEKIETIQKTQQKLEELSTSQSPKSTTSSQKTQLPNP